MPFTLYYRPQHLETVNRHLAAFKGEGSGRLAKAIESAVVEGNKEARLRGVDRTGRTLTPLKSERKGKYAGATGPPLAPFGERSRSITQFFVRITRKASGWTMVAGFEGEGAEILGYHATGSGHNPVRDVFGTNPKVFSAVRSLFKGFVAGLFKR